MSAATIEARGAEDLPQPVLLLGRIGMLGRAWEARLADAGVAFEAPDIADLDMMVPSSLERGVCGRHRLVVNCAAYTDVDGAESDWATAERLNGTAVGELSRRCAAVGATLLHYSTDYVFSGEADRPYATDEPVRPVNAYGRSKALGEARLLESGCDFLLVRTSWLYAPWGRNFVRTIAGLMAKRDTLEVVDDQWGRPTRAAHLAEASITLCAAGVRGIRHVTDGGMCTWHAFAEAIGRNLGSACDVKPCASSAIVRAARRPRYSVLEVSATEHLLGPLPPWQSNLAAVLAELAEAGSPGA